MIVKVTSYTRKRAAIKATIRYIQHRPNKEGERVTRSLFGADGPLERYHTYWMIDGMRRGTVFYRVALSPDPKKEDAYKDLDLQWMTQVAMRYLKEKIGLDIQFFAVEHNDQTEIRHVNAVLLIPGKLSKQQFRMLPKLLREAAALDAKLQRETLAPVPVSASTLQPLRASQFFFQEENRGGGSRREPVPKQTCPSCGPSQRMWRIDDELYKCPGCGEKYEMNYARGLHREGAALSL